MLLGEGKIDQELVDQMRDWPHSGFSVDNAVYLPAGDTSGLQRLAEYMLRCPFSLARIICVTESGSVVYRAQKGVCRRFPTPASRDLAGGASRNFQVFDALDILAELAQHIPDKGETWLGKRVRSVPRQANGLDRSTRRVRSPHARKKRTDDGAES